MPVTLRPMHAGDEETAVKWGQDRAFCLANGWDLNMPAERIRKHQRGLIESPPPGLLRLGIECEGRLIGYVALQDVNAETAEFGIAIGESGLWGQGIGQQAGKLLLSYAFHELHLKSVWAEVHGNQPPRHGRVPGPASADGAVPHFPRRAG